MNKKVSGLSAGSLERFVLRARRAAGVQGVVNVLVTSGAAVRSLNRQFRGKNKATDVLSFPALSSTAPFPSTPRRQGVTAGDIAICAEIAVQNSLQLGHSPAQEVKILALHGILHLAGFDHERDNGEMARKEAKLRRALHLPTALIERRQPEHSQHGKPSLKLARTVLRTKPMSTKTMSTKTMPTKTMRGRA